MSARELGPETIRDQLERILRSPCFAKNQRLSRFLRFIIERHLAGCDHELKETVIGTEVLNRPPGYNPRQDAIVRTEATRLRARLAEYYLTEGASDSVVFELPKGGYVPVIRTATANQETVSSEAKQVSRVTRGRLATAASLATIAIVLTFLVSSRFYTRSTPIQIAVLPFDNLNRDPAYDYLADGLTDELIRILATFDGLAPRSRASSFALKGKPRNAREAGNALGVEYLIDGSILRFNNRLRIDAQLIRTRDDVPVWSGRFDRDVSDAIEIEDEISRAIVNDLRVRLGHGRQYPPTSPEAYDFYLRARSLGFRDSVSQYQAAIARDPSFAPAYAGLAATYAYRTSTVYFDRGNELIKMRAAAAKAIELDPLLAEAHYALGVGYTRDGLWGLAEKSFRRALEIEPNRSETLTDFAMYQFALGRLDEALRWIQVAQRADPLTNDIRLRLTWILFASHRYGEAERECGKLIEPFQSECFGRVRLAEGRNAQAVSILEAEVAKGVAPGAQIRGYLAYAYGKVGRRSEAEKIAETDRPNAFHCVLAWLGVGDRKRAVDELERMAPQGPIRVGIALAGPELESLRANARIKILRKESGLPE